MDPGDRSLGELPAGIELVDDATLASLWLEARRQRRSLRQVLLASGKLTVYQMALIESGNVEGQPWAIRRRGASASHAIGDCVSLIDPRTGCSERALVLRPLNDSMMQTQCDPDEFRQRSLR